MENVSEDKVCEREAIKPYNIKKIFRNCLIVVLAIWAGYIHYRYVSLLHENDFHFSHLSDLEREMSLRTEMGFYYSYFKTVVQERPFVAGMSKLMYDRLVEYPKDVNAFNRFNIHPEVIIGGLYRYFEPWLNTSTHRQCHLVDRGEDLPPVESCIGVGHPIMFYLEAVWVLAGLLGSVVFLHGVVLSETLLGGLLAITQYFANHSECTRVQWAPNERENLAAPLLFLQMCVLTMQLRKGKGKTCFELQIAAFVLNCICLLFWQFTQFIFLTQTAIFFVMEQFRIIDLKTLCVFLHSHFCGLHMAVLLLQGNDMLKSSLYTSFFIVISAYCLFFSSFRIQVKTKLDFLVESWLVFIRISLAVLSSFYLKGFLSDFLGVEEDRHIWDLLYSKFTTFRSFHTMIYTCSDVFDFLPLKTVVNYLKTLLIPAVWCASINFLVYWLVKGLNDTKMYYDNGNVDVLKVEQEKEVEDRIEKDQNKESIEDNEERRENNESDKDDTDDSGIENNTETLPLRKSRLDLDIIYKQNTKEQRERETNKDKFIMFLKLLSVDAAIFYNISQMVVFGVMAALFMRLKMLFGTQMCIVSSLVANDNFKTNFRSRYSKTLFWSACIAILLYHLYQNMAIEMSYVGEFKDVYQEELLEWISKETSEAAVFAGSMPILAAVMLTTRRAIVAHPHYEHSDARDRAYAVYKMYGRFSPYELYQELNKLKATYIIVENKYCYGSTRKGCSFQNIWDIEAPSYKGRARLCHTLLTQPTDHLYKVFVNEEYAVFRVHDLSVRYMPRVFDT